MSKDLEKEVQDLSSKYDNLKVNSAEWDEERGVATMQVSLTGGPTIPRLPEGVDVISVDKESAGNLIGKVTPNYKDAAALRRIDLDPLDRSDLDLLDDFSVLKASPHDVFQRSIDYYRTKDEYGTAINTLTNFASKGFENDIDDPTIKNFFDCWILDTGFDAFVEKIFLDFFRVGMVRTYKIMGKYEPKINFLSPNPGQERAHLKETALRGNRFTGSRIPIAYTILNPMMVDIQGSLMFGQTAIYLKARAGEEIKKILEMPKNKLSPFQRKIIDNLPANFKKAVEDNKDIPLDPALLGEVDYRRQPYERYPVPRGARVFEAIQFKDELRKADYSTLDGISNYILKITIGNDNFPVDKQEALEKVGEMFDTVSKSFKVVWNHTLNVEKITSPEIGEILGQDKYKQVNDDITMGLGVPRALLDGGGSSNSKTVELAVKAVIEEINYARRQVKRWIYEEYRSVAEAMKFDRIPKVRFDDMALRDEIQMMSIIQGMIDRRIISYRTGQKKLEFDPDTELAQMKEEKPLVEDGTLGLVGSPFQQSGRQQNQGTPQGTPSEGRPRGRPAKTPDAKDESQPPKASASEELESRMQELSLDELEELLKKVKAAKEG